MNITLHKNSFLPYLIRNGCQIFKHKDPTKVCFFMQQNIKGGMYRYIFISPKSIDRDDAIVFSTGESIFISPLDLMKEDVVVKY